MQRNAQFLLVLFLGLGLAACGINDDDGADTGGGGGGGGGGGTVCSPDTSQSTGSISVSGKVSYDRVPVQADNSGLDYGATFAAPARRVEVAAVCGNQSYAEAATDEQGNYSLSGVPNSSDFIIRVRARSSDYDFSVVDNTNGDALYTLDSSVQNADADLALDLHAASGWTGSSYGEPRAAAPFAILDSVTTAADKIKSVDPAVSFPALQLNWSTANTATDGDISAGEIGTTFYTRDNQGSQIFILGDADADTDEYDDHVIIHEWGHYLEDRLSRSDSIGGPHGGADKLDLRVAYGEGFGNAWSAIATDDPVYFDTNGQDQATGFFFNMEFSADPDSVGWYSETSVQRLLWDFYDTANGSNEPDIADSMGLGLAPLYGVWADEQKNTDALTSIHSFAWALHADQAADPAAQSWIVALLQGHDINGSDIWGSGETNSPDETPSPEDDGLPVYHRGDIDQPNELACSDKEYDEYNKSTNRQFYRIQPASDVTVNIQVTESGDSRDTDPDFVLHHRGQAVALTNCSATSGEQCGQGGQEGSESARASLTGGQDYVLEVYDYYNVDNDPATGGRVCFSVAITT